MDPPDAYAPPNMEPVPAEELHPFLGSFHDEHIVFGRELNRFEEAILSVQKVGYTREADAGLRRFFDVFDREFIAHHRREEARLFPLLHERLLARGEHSKGDAKTTATDLMVDEHAKAMQLAAVMVNFLGLAFRLPDRQSGMMILDAALEQGRSLAELLRLHVFREDNLILPLAHRSLSAAELDALQRTAR